MKRGLIAAFAFSLGSVMLLASCSNSSCPPALPFSGLFKKSGLAIVDAKMSTGIDDKLLPVDVTTTFPKETPQVVVWFKWKNGSVNTEVVASWHYVTDDIHVLDYTFSIPRKEGSGSVSLSMPEGKTLPPGSYKLDLKAGKKLLKSLSFTVAES